MEQPLIKMAKRSQALAQKSKALNFGNDALISNIL
jgi:hypothetical protein